MRNTNLSQTLEPRQENCLRTYRVDTFIPLGEVVRLVNNYSYVPIRKDFLKYLISHPDHGLVELLYGPSGKDEEGNVRHEEKAVVVFVRGTHELVLARFAYDPWFEEETAISWAQHRIERILSLYRLHRIAWLVDEKNLPLQLALKKRNYRGSILPGSDGLFKFIGESNG